jgi:hypothetical protein
MNTTSTNTSNDTADLQITYESEHAYVESHSAAVKVLFVLLALVSMTSTLFAITFMLQTRKIPYATRFITTGLLVFDLTFIVLSTIRKFITDPVLSYTVQTILTNFLQMTIFTVGLMSIERYFVITRPMLYIRVVNKQLVRKIVLIAWICVFMLCVSMRYGFCYLRYQSMSVFTTAGFCNKFMTFYYSCLQVTILCISCGCYWKIYRCINKVTSSTITTANTLRGYRSTYLAFVYLLVIILSSFGYFTIIILVQTNQIQNTTLRLSMEAVSFFNCILDPFLYVFWYDECRMQFVKCLGICSERYRQKAEQWRIDVYNIVTVHHTSKQLESGRKNAETKW